MADVQVERLVYIVEVQDKGSDAFNKIGSNAEKMGDRIKNSIGGIEYVYVKMGTTLLDVFGDVINALKDFAEITAEVFVDSVKAAAKFEDQLGGARKTMGLTAEDTEALGKRLREMALDFSEGGLAAGVAQEELAKIAELAGQMNISFSESPADFENFIKTVAMASGAFKMSAEQTATALGGIKNAFRLTMDELPGVAGAIDIVGNSSIANEPYIMEFVNGIGVMAEKVGMTKEQMIAMGGVMGDFQVSNSVAVTAMSQTFGMLRTELDRFGEVLSAGGVTKAMLEAKVRAGDMYGALQLVAQGLNKINEIDELAADQALKDLGFEGKRVLLAFQALQAGQEKFVNYQEMIKDPINNSASLLMSYKNAIDTMNERFKQAGVLINEVRMVIGEKLSNAIETVMEKYINPFLERFAKWIKESPVAQAILTELGRTIEVIGAIVGEALQRFMDWLEGMDTLAGNQAVHEWFARLQSGIESLWEKIKSLASDGTFDRWISAIGAGIETLWNALNEMDWNAIFSGAVALLQDIGHILANDEQAATGLGKAIQGISNFIEDLVYMTENWRDVSQEAYYNIEESISGLLYKIPLIGDALKAMHAVATFVFTGMVDAIFNVVHALAEKLVQAVDEVGKVLNYLGKLAFGESVFPDMTTWAETTASAVEGITTSTKGVSGALTEVGGKMAQAVSAQQEYWNKLQENMQRAKETMATIDTQGFAEYNIAAMKAKFGDDWWKFVNQTQAYRGLTQPTTGNAPAGAAVTTGESGVVGAQNAEGGPALTMYADTPPKVDTPVNITINGANLTDSQTLARFARDIQKMLQESRQSLFGVPVNV